MRDTLSMGKKKEKEEWYIEKVKYSEERWEEGMLTGKEGLANSMGLSLKGNLAMISRMGMVKRCLLGDQSTKEITKMGLKKVKGSFNSQMVTHTKVRLSSTCLKVKEPSDGVMGEFTKGIGSKIKCMVTVFTDGKMAWLTLETMIKIKKKVSGSLNGLMARNIVENGHKANKKGSEGSPKETNYIMVNGSTVNSRRKFLDNNSRTCL
jgi:hypothetical protein